MSPHPPLQYHQGDFELFASRGTRDQSLLSNMSEFKVSDFFAISRLIMRMSEDYASAPTEGQELAGDLRVLQDCIETLRKSSENFSPEDNARLAERIAPLTELLKEMEKLSEKYSSLTTTDSEPRVWDRVRFPKLKVQAINKRINLHLTTLNLFMGIRSTASLGNIEDVLEKFAKNNPGGAFLRSDENWNRSLLPELQQRGVALDSAERCRTFIEEHLVALSEVEVANSQLLDNYEGSIVPEDAIDEQIIVGGPTPDHTFSCICPGALKLQNGDLSGIKESQSLFYRHFGGHRYELSCKHCKFHGFQDEPFKTKEVGAGKKINTPLLFCSREKALGRNSTEYYLDAHKMKRGIPDGLFYHTLFFWKSHVPAKEPAKHDTASYECVFCPPESAFGALMDRKQYIDHIRLYHVQKPPSADLRARFNVYIDTNRPALFKSDEGRCEGKKFDILLPRALGRTDIIRAEQARREAEVVYAQEEERRLEEVKKAALAKAAAEEAEKKKAEDAKLVKEGTLIRRQQASDQVAKALSPAFGGASYSTPSGGAGLAAAARRRQLQLEQGQQPKLLPPSSIPRPLAWRESQEKLPLPIPTPRRSILKNRGEAGKAVHFELDDDETEAQEQLQYQGQYQDQDEVNFDETYSSNIAKDTGKGKGKDKAPDIRTGERETWEQTLARLDEEKRLREEQQPVLSLVKTTYTPKSIASARAARCKIVEVSSSEVGEGGENTENAGIAGTAGVGMGGRGGRGIAEVKPTISPTAKPSATITRIASSSPPPSSPPSLSAMIGMALTTPTPIPALMSGALPSPSPPPIPPKNPNNTTMNNLSLSSSGSVGGIDNKRILLNSSPESRIRMLRREEIGVGMGDLDSAVDVSGA